MGDEWSDAIGAQVFGMLVSLLRPVARRRQPGDSFAESDRVELPAQRTEIRVTQSGRRASAQIQLWLTSATKESLALAWTLPLPLSANVESLELQCMAGREPAGLCERREAREWFDLARRAGLPGALLAEDAPGVFGLEVATPGCGALRVTLECAWTAARADTGDLTVRCEAAAGSARREGRSRLLHLGSSHRLDALVGIASMPEAGMGLDRHDATGAVRADIAPNALRSGAGAQRRPDVFAVCDRGDSTSAMYRGSIGGRSARLWAGLSAPKRASGAQAAEVPAAAEIRQLMSEYRETDRSEAERRDLASRVARIGLEAGLATLWTSFVAVVGSRDPGGELVFAAA